MKARILFLLALFCLSFPVAADVTVASPDGKVQFVLSSSAQRHLQYTVTFNSKSIIEPSPVGDVVDRADLAHGAQIGAAESYKINEKGASQAPGMRPWFCRFPKSGRSRLSPGGAETPGSWQSPTGPRRGTCVLISPPSPAAGRSSGRAAGAAPAIKLRSYVIQPSRRTSKSSTSCWEQGTRSPSICVPAAASSQC
jgi:hypothetical protein